jgi:hypothetical protein
MRAFRRRGMISIVGAALALAAWLHPNLDTPTSASDSSGERVELADVQVDHTVSLHRIWNAPRSSPRRHPLALTHKPARTGETGAADSASSSMLHAYVASANARSATGLRNASAASVAYA